MGQSERTTEVMAQLEAGITNILDSEAFARYLQTMARFHHYSFSNVLLILQQRPDATKVAGYRKWQELGRQVRKGEKGLKILVPHRRKLGEDQDGEPLFAVTSFGVGTVFDLSQTDGEELPSAPSVALLDGDPDLAHALSRRLTEALLAEGVTVTREPLPGTIRGSYTPSARAIVVHAELPTVDACATLLHEAAHHAAAHQPGMERHDAETVAECAAYVVAQHFGLDTGAKSFPYVARWAQDHAVLKRNLTAIQKTADALIASIAAADLATAELPIAA